ncbi:E3 ubiquitin-protein ligase MYLIP isoform X2 [Anabrus simplex]|uniref:E3 ubiquitin-protein ligase MYLIP isoform X2 n=1 Tax=Anabrus simplex TaxID=316456 RepID=UPI0034DD7329
MWCLVSQPNSVILEVEVDPKAKGQECLEKVCQCLGISKESDYFGLKFHCAKGEELWLNLRNPIERQVTGITPYRFALRVKFWVPPHLLLQDTTRHQFYLHARLELLEGRLKVTNWSEAAKLVAFMAQAEYGDFDQLTCPHSIYAQTAQIGVEEEMKPPDYFQRVAVHHKELKYMKPSAAEYWLLKEVSYLESFGEEMFQIRNCSGSSEARLGVGPHGLTLYQSDPCEKQSIPYTAVQSAASHRRTFHLMYLSLDGDETSLDVKLETSQAASGLYRAITEKHAFYSCETVRSAVTAQFIRDLKSSKRQLARLLEAISCRICMDRGIDTAFFPCAHVMACSECAARCERCPLCRGHIEQSQRIYLPLELQQNGLKMS